MDSDIGRMLLQGSLTPHDRIDGPLRDLVVLLNPAPQQDKRPIRRIRAKRSVLDVHVRAAQLENLVRTAIFRYPLLRPSMQTSHSEYSGVDEGLGAVRQAGKPVPEGHPSCRFDIVIERPTRHYG